MKTLVLTPKVITTAVMAAGAIFYGGWVASAAHFNIASHWAHDKKVAVVLPALKAEAAQAVKACERNAGTALENDASIRDVVRCPPPTKVPALVQSVLVTK